mmetsp:Transcript_130408/g.225461  ORF Transcript_130408/g.225461 Transcript_130408/m.225461 type:complete len:149 (-) Transcript_130408:409-855(-)
MSIMLEDTFEVKELDPEGKKFDLVSRGVMRSERHEMDCIMDINIDVYPIDSGMRLTIAWAKTIDLEGKPSPEHFDKALCTGKKPSLMDNYDYVTCGRVYKVDALQQQMQRIAVYISYGGLLQKIIGEPHDLKDFEMDAIIYCLVRKLV